MPRRAVRHALSPDRHGAAGRPPHGAARLMGAATLRAFRGRTSRAPGRSRSLPIDDWLLTAAERGNRATELPAWSDGNQVTAPRARLGILRPAGRRRGRDDRRRSRMFTDWRGDPDQLLRPGRPDGRRVAVGRCPSGGAGQGSGVAFPSRSRGAHGENENRDLAEDIGDEGGQVLLDQRIRYFGSHHQKFVIARHPGEPERDVAFAGGIDLCHRATRRPRRRPPACRYGRCLRHAAAMA